MPAKRFSVLFITASRIGDAVLSSGLIRSLVEEIPGARFTIVASALTAPLFARTPGLERLIVMEKRPLGLHWWDLWGETRGRHWGLVIDMRGSGLSNFLRRGRRGVRRGGGAPAHKVVEAARLLRLEHDPPAPRLYTDEAIEARADALTAGAGPILAIAPAANWVGKTWPAERFAMLARALLADGGPMAGGRLMILGGPGDRAATLPLTAAIPKNRRLDLAGAEDLLVCYAALRRCRLFVGNDSGLMHMAAAAGAPTLGLFGPSDETLYGPWGPAGASVRGARTFAQIRAADPGLNQQICHMMDLSVSAVFAAACDLLERTAPAADSL